MYSFFYSYKCLDFTEEFFSMSPESVSILLHKPTETKDVWLQSTTALAVSA